MLIYFEIWAQSHSIGVRFVLSTVLSSKPNIVPGGGGYRFRLRRDSLSRTLKGRQSTFAANFRCVPTTFGDASSYECNEALNHYKESNALESTSY